MADKDLMKLFGFEIFGEIRKLFPDWPFSASVLPRFFSKAPTLTGTSYKGKLSFLVLEFLFRRFTSNDTNIITPIY